MISKRYKDIFSQYIYKGEKIPFTLGTLVVCAFCFLLLIVASFTQFSLVFPWMENSSQAIAYNPQIPIMIFIIYLLGRTYSLFVLFLYLIIGLFLCPIFAFGSGLDIFHNYLFGYFLGFFVAIFIQGTILSINQYLKARIISCLLGIFSIHITGIIYCLFLALLKVIDFSFIMPIANAVSFSKIIYDVIFSLIIILIAPYIKNVFWVCMNPKPRKKKINNKEYRAHHKAN